MLGELLFLFHHINEFLFLLTYLYLLGIKISSLWAFAVAFIDVLLIYDWIV